MEKPRKFVALDALRGAASIAVVFFHTAHFFGCLLFPHGYLAVDFFFMLSGFVLSFAYQEKIDHGGFLLEFLKTRLIRLYPLYLAAFLLGLLLLLLQRHVTPALVSTRSAVLIGLCGLILLPLPPGVSFADRNAFPLDSPAWSLFGEFVANVLHAAFLRRRSTTTLAVLSFLLAGVVVFASWPEGLEYGWARLDVYFGVTRVMFSYILGMLLYRLHQTGRFRTLLPPSVACLILLGLLDIPTPAHHRAPLDLLIVLILFPLLLISSAQAQASPIFEKISTALGLASYAIYVLHVPVSWAFDHVWVRLRGMPTERDVPWPGIIFVVLMVPLATAADKYYDTPVRRWLSRSLLRRRSA